MVKRLLGTTALVGVGLLATGEAAGAAEVLPGGALDISVSGFVRFLAVGGDVDNIHLDRSYSNGLDFFNDTEVHFLINGKHDATGLEYGAHIEFEADTNRTDNTDESWVFLRGAFGEVRLGDEDGVADADGLAVSADTVSLGIGTDGLDSDQFEVLGGGVRSFEAFGTGDSTKIRYYTPVISGFQAGVSYTPNLSSLGGSGNSGDNLAARGVAAGDVWEGGINYTSKLGSVGLTLGVTGLYGDIKNEDAAGGDDYWAYQGGAVVDIAGFQIGGSYLKEEAGRIEVTGVTAGIAWKQKAYQIALTYGQLIDTENLFSGANAGTGVELDKPWEAILSGTVGLMPGLTLAGDVGYFDNEVKDGNGPSGGDNGWQALGRLGLAF